MVPQVARNSPDSGPPPDELAACVAGLRELMLACERYRLAVASYLGVTVNDSQAISYLLARGPMGQQDLADALDMTTGSITTLVDRLSERNLVRRSPHPTDRRRSVVRLSANGERALREVRHWMTGAFEDLDPAQLRSIAPLLQSISGSLRRHTATLPDRPRRARPAPRRRR